MQIALVSNGLNTHNIHLQPFSYLFDIVRDLRSMGHDVILFTNRSVRNHQENTLLGFEVIKLNLFTERIKVIRLINDLDLDIVLWHLGITSFLHIRGTLEKVKKPIIGIFTSPFYKKNDLLRLGFTRLITEYKMTLSPLVGLFVSNKAINRLVVDEILRSVITESETTKEVLISKGLPVQALKVIKPTISEHCLNPRISPDIRNSIRQKFGFTKKDIIVCFFGPPPFLRGLPSLINAVFEARKQRANINLLILSRERRGEFKKEHNNLNKMLQKLNHPNWIKLISGFLDSEQLVSYISSCDIVALPFELVPSDVPLSVLEAMALGMPIITTKVSCLSEMVPEGSGICIPPGDINLLSDAIIELAQNQELRTNLGEMGRKYVTKWLDTNSRKTTIISSILENHE